jgi:hypothetical protein
VTPELVAELVAETPLPPGYRLVVTPQRKYRYRSLWAVRLFHDGTEVWSRAYYNVAVGIIQAQAVAYGDSGKAA